jgi:hypothetical protein
MLHGQQQETVFSWINYAVIILLLVFSLGCAVLITLLLTGKVSFDFLDKYLGDQHRFWGITILLALITLEAGQDLFYLAADLKPIYYPMALVENRAVLIWAAFVFTQSLLVWLILGLQAGTIQLQNLKTIPLWMVGGILIGAFVLLVGGKGSLPSNAPLPALHIIVAGLLVLGGWLGFSFLLKKIPWLKNVVKNDLLVLIVLWVGAFLLWSNVPLQPNYFIGSSRPPNFEYTPTSDAIYYEIQAQRFLVGEGFEDQVQHSFYVYLTGILHSIGGEHYLDIIQLQIALLALTPFFIYKLGSLLYSRFSGWLAAILFIMREFNALRLGDSITVSNVQELMTEPITILGVVLFLYLSILWLKSGRESRGMPILIGSVIGITALIRVELLSMVVVFGLMIFIYNRNDWKKWLIPGLFLVLGLALTLSPWMIRNYHRTGVLTIDKGVVVRRTVQNYLSGDSSGQDQSITDPQQILLQRLEKSYKKASRIWDRSFASLQQTLVYLPSNHFPLGGLDYFVKIVPEKSRVYFFQEGIFSDAYLTSYIKSLPYWEMNWGGKISPRSYLPLALVMVFISYGIHLAWKNFRCAGLLPLGVMVVHILIYAVVLGSGGRYIQVVDWITLLYFSLGFAGGIVWLSRVLLGRELPISAAQPVSSDQCLAEGSQSGNKWRGLGWSLVIITMVTSMPIVESIIPRIYTETYLRTQLENLPERVEGEVGIGPGSEQALIIGKALYPGYYGAEEKFVDDRSGRMPEPGRDQVVFYLVGQENIWVSLPISEAPESFPHGSEVIVLGHITRDSNEDLDKKMLPYFIAEQILIYDRNRLYKYELP